MEETLEEEEGLTIDGRVGGFLLDGDLGGDLGASFLSLGLNMPLRASKRDLERVMRLGADSRFPPSLLPSSSNCSTSYMGVGVLLRLLGVDDAIAKAYDGTAGGCCPLGASDTIKRGDTSA